MNFDFELDKKSLYIPKEVYRPIKKCPFCQSVFITDTACEACGRNLDYNLVGKPFSPKSFYRIKEKYVQSFPFLLKMFPIFENKKGLAAQSYIRNLKKRTNDILIGFSSVDLIKSEDRRYFYFELKEIILELLDYGVKEDVIFSMIESNESEDLIHQELLVFLQSQKKSNLSFTNWSYLLMNYKVWGVLRLEFILKFAMVFGFILFVAIKLRPHF
jgi:hypothetical protein